METKKRSLIECYPNLSAEWDYEKNGDITPDTVTPGSGKTVWWVCSRGHHYQSIIENRTKGVGCPYCSGKRVLPGYNDLGTLRPDIAAEWNYEKNGDLTPDQVTAKSGKRVWWRCSQCGKEWETNISNRDQTLCRECSKKRGGTRQRNSYAIKNGLVEKYPALAKEWHPELNEDLLPKDVSAGSSRKVWWICPEGHSFQSTVSHRIAGTGCPYCSGKKALSGFNDLRTIMPEIVPEWNDERNGDLTPDQVTIKSGKKVWWKCSKGHAYVMTVANRTSGQGCPYCAGRYAVEGVNDLETLYPEIAEEWNLKRNDPIKPNQVLSRSNKKVWWTCPKGHDYEATPAKRVEGQSCPYCSNHKVLSGFNDLATCDPELAKEWHPTKNGELLPSMVTLKGNTVVWWKCSVCGHEWKVSLNSRCGCPRCSAKRQTSFPEQAIFYYVQQVFPDAINRYEYRGRELDIYIPSRKTAIEYDGVYFHATDKALQKDNTKDELCKEDGITLIRIRDPQLERTSGAVIIPCMDTTQGEYFKNALRALFQIFSPEAIPDIDLERDNGIILAMTQMYYANNSLADLYPTVAEEWEYEKNLPLIPQNVPPKSNQKVWWKCKKGHEWKATVGSRTAGTGCPYCSGKKCLPGENDLLTLRPDIAAEWNYEKNGDLTPDQITSKSNKKVWWKCSICGTEWLSSVSNMRQPHCKRCSHKLLGKKLTAQYAQKSRVRSVSRDNSLATLYPDVAKQWNWERNTDLSPDRIAGKSGKKVWWRCEKGHEWESSILNRVKDNLGCPYCSNQKVLAGFNDLATQNPVLTEEWNWEKNKEVKPTAIVPGSGKKVWWKCRACGTEWEAIIRLRNKGMCQCPNCKNKQKSN